MKKALKKLNRTLSIMLAAAMVLTMAPQTAMPVLAAEEDAVIETQVETEAADIAEADESTVDPTADEEEESTEGDDQESADADVDDLDANDADASGSDAAAEGDSAFAADIIVNDDEDKESNEGDGKERNTSASAETFDITIDEFIAVKRQMKKIEVVIGETETVPVTNAKITVEKGKDVTLRLTPKAGFKIKTVMDGENKLEAAEAAGVYSYVIGAVTAAKTIKITTATAYDIDLDNAMALGTSITLDESLKNLASELTLGGAEGKTKSVVEKAANQDVKFTVAGFDADDEANADKKLHVYYVVDNSEDEMTEIQAVEGKYTVSADEISIVEESVKIILEVEMKSAVTFTENANVEVKVQGKDAEEKDVWVATDAVGAIDSAFVGDEFKFKAEGKAPYAVSKVIVNGEEINLAEDGVYTIILEKATMIAFETEIDSKQSVPLTFTIEGEKNSATARITSVTPAAAEGETPEALTGPADIAKKLGITSVDLEAGKAVRVPKTVTALTVTVAPTNGYILSAEEEKDAKTEYKFATEADAQNDVTAIGTAMNVNVKTEVEALTDDSVFFKATVKTDDPGLEDLKVITEMGKVEQAKKENQDVEDVYEIKKGAATVKFTVKAKIGYILKDITENAMVQFVTEKEAEDGSIEYTVAIFAKQIAAKDTDSVTAFEVESEKRKFTAKIEPDGINNSEFALRGYYYVVPGETDENGKEITHEVYGNENQIPYGALLKTTIEANYGRSLTVTYTMGGETVKIPVHDAWYGDRIDAADVSIKVTADVTINVETSKNYSLSTLIDQDSKALYGYEGVYEVRYDTAYLVGVKVGRTQIPAKDVTVVVKNAKGEVVFMSTPVVSADYPVANTTYRKINLANKPEFRGQDITVEMYVAGVEEKVGTYVLSVYNETTKIEIQDANGAKIDKIVQSVDSYVEYAIDTDGILEEVPEITGDSNLIEYAEIYDDKLVIVTAAKSSADIKGKTATVSVWAKDNEDVTATVTVTAKALFDESKAPRVTKLVNAAADTVFHVDVEMDLGEDFQKPYNGSLWYEVKAEAKPGTDGKTLPPELQQTVTTHIERTGKNHRVKLEVGKNELLGTGAEWDYEVTAQLIYMNSDWYDDYSDYDDDNIVVKSAVSEKEECGTVEPLFTTALKLKKGSDKVALYTGRETDSVIATIQWDKKDADEKFYKVADENIQDDKDGLTFAVRGDQIVVTNIDVNAELGKHNITVLATADRTPGHEMYASRATIAVTVVKGINSIIVMTPSTSIYKLTGTSKAATLKLGVDYNHAYVGESDDYYAEYASWNGKKYVTAPKAKKVIWEIVSADWSDADCVGPISPIPPKNIADYVKVKNGTITVDKKFQVDENHASNNRFMVKVTAADYAGNETYGLSDVIEISNKAVDISKLIIAKYNGNEYEVKAVHDITDKNAVTISASDADCGYVFAMPATAAVQVGDQFSSQSDMNSKLPVVDTNTIAFASGNKKILEVDEDGYINVLAAGKKAAVKVTTVDGSKKTHTMNLTLDYKATAGNDLALGIQVRTADNSYSGSGNVVFDPNTEGNVAKANTANVKETPVTADFNATGAARLYVQLYVGDKADAASTSYSRPADVWSTNYKLAVKGGKFVTNANGTAAIITTAKETTLTLTDQSPEAKKVKKAAYVYKLTNTAYDTTKVAKAPKVTVKNTLHQWGISEEQKVELTVLDATKQPYATGKSAKIEMDWSARTDKNEWNLNQFAGNIKSNIVALSADGSIKLEFTGDADLTPGSYKLKVTVGTEQDGLFTAETLPATVTVKVIKAKVATFKLNTTYKISKLDGGAVLTGKSNLNAKAGEKMTTSFSGLKNANVNGKSNNFTKYFEIKHDPDGTCRLAMTEYLKAELENGNKEMTDLDKKDLTGYITYHAQPNVSYYNTSKLVETEVKITVKPVKSTK